MGSDDGHDDKKEHDDVNNSNDNNDMTLLINDGSDGDVDN